MSRTANLPANSPYITVQQAAHVMGCSTHHVYVMCNRGELKHVRWGHSVRIDRDALLKQSGLSEERFQAALEETDATNNA